MLQNFRWIGLIPKSFYPDFDRLFKLNKIDQLLKDIPNNFSNNFSPFSKGKNAHSVQNTYFDKKFILEIIHAKERSYPEFVIEK